MALARDSFTLSVQSRHFIGASLLQILRFIMIKLKNQYFSLENGPTKNLKEVQNDLMGFINADTILVGHGLENDLR